MIVCLGQLYVFYSPCQNLLAAHVLLASHLMSIATVSVQGVAEQECRRAADIAEAAYAAAFNEAVVPDEKQLDDEHARCLAVAKQSFDEIAVGEDKIKRAHEKRFWDACASR